MSQHMQKAIAPRESKRPKAGTLGSLVASMLLTGDAIDRQLFAARTGRGRLKDIVYRLRKRMNWNVQTVYTLRDGCLRRAYRLDKDELQFMVFDQLLAEFLSECTLEEGLQFLHSLPTVTERQQAQAQDSEWGASA